MNPRRNAGTAVAAALFCALQILAPAGAAAKTYTVALLPFPGAHETRTEESGIVTTLLASNLAANPGIRLVEEDTINDELSRLKLDPDSIAEPDQAVRVGSATGAEIVITGRLTFMGRKNALFARVTGVKTSRTETHVVTASRMDPVTDMLEELSRKIIDTVTARGDYLAGAPGEGDPALQEIRKKIGDRKLPSLSFSTREIFGGRESARSLVEEELRRILGGVGFRLTGKPASAADVTLSVQALGELSARTGGLVSSSVDLRIKATTPAKKVLATTRERFTASDLTREAASSRAFREAATAAAPDLVLAIVEEWNR